MQNGSVKPFCGRSSHTVPDQLLLALDIADLDARVGCRAAVLAEGVGLRLRDGYGRGDEGNGGGGVVHFGGIKKT